MGPCTIKVITTISCCYIPYHITVFLHRNNSNNRIISFCIHNCYIIDTVGNIKYFPVFHSKQEGAYIILPLYNIYCTSGKTINNH